MVNILEYKRGLGFSFDADYVFDAYQTYLDLKPRLMPKLIGKYKFVFNLITLEEASTIVETESEIACADIDIYLKRDVLERFRLNNPKYDETKLSKWNAYLKLVQNFGKDIERRASAELYHRAKGDLERAAKVLEQLKTVEDSTITLKHINKFIQRDDTVYARDVLLCAIAKGSRRADSFLFKKYQRTDTFELAYKVELYTSRSLLFYSMRKFATALYEDKLNHLKNVGISNPTNRELVRHLDYMVVTRIYLLFQLSTVDQVYIILNDIEKGESTAAQFAGNYLIGHLKED
jgi:hypothetical protein